jgi:hypothetical protein
MKWNVTEKHFVAHSDRSRNLIIRLFNYPAWRVLVNGKSAPTQTTDVTGLIVIPVPAGDNDVLIYFGRTFDRTAGAAVSVISFCVFAAAWIKTQSQKVGRAGA